METSATALRIGDLITLKNIKFDGYLGAEGILLEEVVVQDSGSAFDDSIFCVHLPRQYSAARELEEFLEVSGAEKDENSEKFLMALKRGRANESKLNDSYLAQKLGHPVHFGDNIQVF